MYLSTKQYVQRQIFKLMKQCGISLEDIETALLELKTVN
jgi:hypothetical protein